MTTTTESTATAAMVETKERTTAVGQIADALRSGADALALISRMYRVEVDQSFLDELRGMKFPQHTGNTAVDEGYRKLVSYLDNTWQDTLTELAVDYVRAFIGHGNDGYSAAYPYESVYTSEKRLLMQDARDEVLAIYRSEGLEKAASWHEGEDHIALELEFVQTLMNRAADALEVGDEAEAARLVRVARNFMEDHLVSWTPMLTVDMRRFAKTDFYRGLADLTDGLLTVERDFLTSLLAD